MERHDKVYVAGHRGLVGSALVRRLQGAGYTNLLLRTRAELDLMDQQAVVRFFEAERPDHVFFAAAKVGGIVANDTHPAEFIHENLAMQTHCIHAAWRAGVRRFLFLGSSCIYPRDCPQPIRESYLLTGPLEPTNRPYAVAKIAGIEMCWSYNRQYGARFLAAMPTNLFGPNDNFDLQSSHVLPALIRKMHEAKAAGAPRVVVWGTGRPRREFLYSDEMADACVFLMTLPEERFAALVDPAELPLINIGSGEDLTIRELAELIAEVVGFRGTLAFDETKPDGTPRKLLDVGKLERMGWRARLPLRDTIGRAYDAFLARDAARAADARAAS